MHLDDERLRLLGELRMLDLPAPRIAYLTRLILAARTPADRQAILSEAQNEARRNAYMSRAAIRKAYDDQREREHRQGAPERPQTPLRAPRRHAEPHPEPRPVSVSYTTPTKQARDESVPVCPPEHPHSDHCYSAHKCRCDRCRASRAKAQRAHRERKSGSAPIERAEPRWTIPPTDPRHGTTSAYGAGCRCEECREAKRQSRTPAGRVRRANGEPAPHGTTTNYQRGCRCNECREAVAAHARMKRQEKKKKSTGDVL